MAATYWRTGPETPPPASVDADAGLAAQVGRLQEDSTILTTGGEPGDILSPGRLTAVTPGEPAGAFTASGTDRHDARSGVDNSVNFYGNVDGDVSRALERQRKERIKRTRTTKVGG